MTAPLKTGRVALVGAGPGDPELLTLRAFRRLRDADVVLHDNLVSDGILALCGDARMVNVGKIPRGPSTSQEVTNALLLREACDGHAVVRLKGGDPFVFGRGGEEAMYLARHGVEVEVVPGISSAVSVPGAAGIPVTHRNVSTHFSVVTAMGADPNRPLEETWRKLAAAGGTVVFLMGLGRLERIIEEIRAAGVPADRPMAAIQSGTCPEQRVVAATVGTIIDRVRAADLRTPATLILGDVVALRDAIATESHEADMLPGPIRAWAAMV